MLIVLDEPQTTKWGGTAAAPVFRAIAVAAAERLGIRIDSPEADGNLTDGSTATRPAKKPNPERPTSFVGLSLREALERARAEGITVEVVGSGYVVRQDPPAGKPVQQDRPIRLRLDPAGEPLG
jgi:hypothetical protein